MTVTIKKRKSNAKADSNDIQTAIDDYGQKYHCDSCSKDITHLIIIRCHECTDFDLCVQCFSNGLELKDHKKTHSYRVIDLLDFPIFDKDWGADEEILLVEALETFGIGNWEHIAEHIGTKNSKECLDHYNKIYVASCSWPYPDMSVQFDRSLKARPPGYTVKKLAKCPRAPASQPANHEIHGYMPGRKEFEHEFENDAEQIVKDIEFLDDDTKEETDLKTTILNNYNRVLHNRSKRKQFIHERNFVDFRRIQSIEKKRTKEEKELYMKYRVFAKMQTAADFELFMDGIIKEHRLRARIATLQEYQRMGIKTVKESQEYERELAIRNSSKTSGSHISNLEKLLKSSTSRRDDAEPLKLKQLSTVTKSATFDISMADGVQLLSEPEKHICTLLRIFPRAYLSIKDTILKENSVKGFVKRRSVRSLIKIDVNKTSRIFDFFVEMGWVNNKAK